MILYIGMSTQSDKDRIIRQRHYVPDREFGGVAETHRVAKNMLNNITYNDVKDFLERQTSRQTKGDRGFDLYVADEPVAEIQIDIGDFTASGALNYGFRYLFVAIDIFTKHCHAIPIKKKQMTMI